ncbi:MAG: cell division protein FtsH, partial [Acidobacteria bacterium]|nr:cell division protein FtsH [Acidobacteriota bacterium]
TEWGMSPALGPLTFGKKEEQIFLGREISQHRDYSEDTAIRIDREVKRIVEEGYSRAARILEENRDALVRLAEGLLEYETLDSTEIEALIKGQPIKPRSSVPSDPEGTPVRDKEPESVPHPQLINPEGKPALA